MLQKSRDATTSPFIEVLASLPNYDFNFALLPIYAELLASVEVADTVRELRFSALRQLQGQLMHYKNRGILESLLYDLAEKKGWMILNISSKTEMQKLMKPHLPHFDGSRFVPDAYHVPEEELICWSETSLLAPLNEIGRNRYQELFQSIFPDEYKEIFGEY